MNGKLWTVALVLVVITTVGGGALLARSPAPGAPVTITEADDGKTIEIHPGDTLVVILDGNPTTGYAWERAAAADGVLAPAGEPEFQPASAALGASGTVTLRFTAQARGQTTLHLVYHRSWESEAPQKDFTVTVVVK